MGESHTLTIENQKRLLATCVAEVNGFSDKEIKISLINGGKIHVVGQNLKITNFQKQSGSFVAEGIILRVNYLQDGKNVFKKLVK